MRPGSSATTCSRRPDVRAGAPFGTPTAPTSVNSPVPSSARRTAQHEHSSTTQQFRQQYGTAGTAPCPLTGSPPRSRLRPGGGRPIRRGDPSWHQNHLCSRCPASPSRSPVYAPSTVWTWRSSPVKSTASSARTAPASRPSSRCWPGPTSPTAAPSPGAANPSGSPHPSPRCAWASPPSTRNSTWWRACRSPRTSSSDTNRPARASSSAPVRPAPGPPRS